MRNSIIALLLFFGCFVGTARGQTGVIALSVTSTPASIVVNQACNYVVLQENAVTPTNPYTITLPGTSTGITEPAGTRFVFSASANGFVKGQSLGTIVIATGSASFVGIESLSSPTVPVKLPSSGGGGGSIVLETNGTPNGSQSLLNSMAGANMSITDGGSGTVVFSASATPPGGTPGQPQFNNFGVFGGFTFGGDCTFSVPNLTCTKTNGVSFAPSATTDTTNGTNITSGTVTEGRLPTATVFTDQSATFGAHTYDFSGVTLFKVRVGAGLTTSANGDIGYDTTNKNWHAWANGVDNFIALKTVASPPTNGDCVNWSVVSSVITLGDAGSACGSGGGGGSGFSAITSGTNTSATMICGTGCSLTPTGSGVNSANEANGTPFAASATTDTTNAANISSGTLPHARLPTLLSGDIPNNAANTSGTAANLSGTPALPNGTSATTQSPGDSSTDLATDAFVAAINPLTGYDFLVGNASGVFTRLAGATSPNGVPQTPVSIPSGSAATAPVLALPGIANRTVGGTTATDTILTTDCSPKRIDYQGSVAVAVTLPTATTLGVPNCTFRIANDTTGTLTSVTVTPTTWTINRAGATGLTSLVITQGTVATFSVDAGGSIWDVDAALDPANIVIQASNAVNGQICTYTGANKTCVPSAALPNGITATTQTAGSNDTKAATDAYADTAVANKVRTVQLTSNYTNSTASFTNVAGGNTIQFSVAASTNYTMQCHLYYQAVSGGGLNIEFTGPASPTNLVYAVTIPVGFTYFVDVVNTSGYGISLGPGEAIVNASTPFDYVITFSLQNGSNAGTVNLLGASYVGGAQAEVQAGSYCRMVTQ